MCGGHFWTLVDALKQGAGAGTDVQTLPGVPDVQSGDVSGIPAAVAMAKGADAVVLAVGTDLTWAAEGHDAKSIDLTDAQHQLIKRVAVAAQKPVVVAIFTATPLDISALLANPAVGAILHLGQPSVTVLGVAPLLFGDRSPAGPSRDSSRTPPLPSLLCPSRAEPRVVTATGRMVQTVYPSAYQHQISIFDFGMRPGPSPFARPDCTDKPDACPKGDNCLFLYV